MIILISFSLCCKTHASLNAPVSTGVFILSNSSDSTPIISKNLYLIFLPLNLN
uniref:Uncharacterized protein n=1 Tax=uncultured marine virus TaxID=186617 RepID=A0A0F7L6T8_9VIRU|nr:hypothetical protein [uncultured marine virus]